MQRNINSGNPSERNVYVLCLSLFVLFAGYNTSQELAPKLLGTAGKVSIAVFYLSATCAGPVPGRVVAAAGTRVALVGSAVVYAAVVLSYVY